MKVDTSGIVIAIILAGLLNSCSRDHQLRLSDTTYRTSYDGKVWICNVNSLPMCAARVEFPDKK